MKRKTIKTSQLILLVIAILVVVDFLFNKGIVLTKLSSKFVNLMIRLGEKFGEYIAKGI